MRGRHAVLRRDRIRVLCRLSTDAGLLCAGLVDVLLLRSNSKLDESGCERVSVDGGEQETEPVSIAHAT